MVTGPNAWQEFLEFFSGQIPTHREPTQSRHMIRQLSRDTTLPALENTQKRASNYHNTSISRLAEAIPEVASQQPPTTSPIAKLASTSTLKFDCKKENFELFEDFFHTMFRMQPETPDAMKINQFHAHLGKFAKFSKHQCNHQKNLEDVLIVFWRKYVKPESRETAKQKWHKLTFDPHTKSLSDFLEESNEYAERAIGDNAQQVNDNFQNAKMPPHLKMSFKLAYRKSGMYDQIVAHLEKKLAVSGIESDRKLPIPTMSVAVTRDNESRPGFSKTSCIYCKNPGFTWLVQRIRIQLQRRKCGFSVLTIHLQLENSSLRPWKKKSSKWFRRKRSLNIETTPYWSLLSAFSIYENSVAKRTLAFQH